MYHKSADSWYIGTEKRGFGAENKSDVPRKRKILVHHFLIRKQSGNQAKTMPDNQEKCIRIINLKHIPRVHVIFSWYYHVKNPSKRGNYSNF